MHRLSFGEGRSLSHAYIAASLSDQARQRTEQIIAAAAVCADEGKKPCGVCRDCRKAKDGVHPDIIHIRRYTDDKGRQKREIQVDQIREMIGQAQIMPNEAAGKAFIIHDAETMNPNAQNALLKLLEEPPKGVVLILSTATPAMLLPTIRSRCIEITVNEEAAALDAELRKEVLTYLQLAAAGKKSALLKWCNEKAGAADVAGAVEFAEAVKTVLTDILCKREEDHGLTRKQCWSLTELMETCVDYLSVNTGVKHVFGLMAVKSNGSTEPIEMRK